jgi:putative tryptophan/tyrosine transport system substrate-binding protein
MRRRAFTAGLAALALPIPTRAQQNSRPRKLAVFSPYEPVAWMREVGGQVGYPTLFAELRRRGWVEGANLVVRRYGREQNTGDLDALAAEAIRGNPDAVLAIGPGVFEIKARTGGTVPLITFTYDPIALGLTQSLSHPGGNLTGISVDTGPTLWGKRIELLREIFPALSKLAFLALQVVSWERFLRPALSAACDAVQLPLVPVLLTPPASEAAYREAVADAVSQGANAIMVAENPETLFSSGVIVDAVAKARLPAMYAVADFVTAGGLMSYSPSFAELHQRVAADVDAILRGTKPGDIPYFQGTKYELSINRNTAAALGLAIPPLLLARADDVIE